MTQEPFTKWPSGLFNCCAGGISLCLWGFLCPCCFLRQGGLSDRSYKPQKSPLELHPPWNFEEIYDEDNSCLGLCLECVCYGCTFALSRHDQSRKKLSYYCSNGACCDQDSNWWLPTEDILIGCFCCCCSEIQVAMAREEWFRLNDSQVQNPNIKRAVSS